MTWEEVAAWLVGNTPGEGQPVPCKCGGWRWQESPVCPRCVRGRLLVDAMLRLGTPRRVTEEEREGARRLVAGHWLSPDGGQRRASSRSPRR